MMHYLRSYIKFIAIASLTLLLSAFTDFSERVPAPKDAPKRTEDKNAGIVIPAIDATPYDIIEKSYDYLNAFMYDPDEGIFMNLSTGLDFKPHKFTLDDKNLGFTTNQAYLINIGFFEHKKSQTLTQFSFVPFDSLSQNNLKAIIKIAEKWSNLFDSLEWKRTKENSNYPYKLIPECPKEKGLCQNTKTYMRWEDKGINLTISLHTNNLFYNNSVGPTYYIKIVFMNSKLIHKIQNEVIREYKNK